MPNSNDILFKAPQNPQQYSALGYIMGKFSPDDPKEGKGYLTGILTAEDGTELSVSITQKSWEQICQKASFTPEKSYYWRLYYWTTKQGYFNRIKLLKPMKELPSYLDETGESIDKLKDLFQVRGRIQAIFDTAFSLQVERNEKPPEGQENSPRWKPFWVTIQGNLPPSAATEQFWEVIATREGERINLMKANYIPDEVGELSEKEPTSSVEAEKENKEESVTVSSPDEDKIMLSGRQPEITVKFSQRPNVPSQGKKVTVTIKGENAMVVQAEVNRKTLAKQVQKMDSYEAWIGAMSGKVTMITNDVIVLEGASVQVFESKKKTAATESEEKAD